MNKILLAAVFMATSSLFAQAQAGETPKQLVFLSDTQYPWTEKSDSDEHESRRTTESRSRVFIAEQFNAIQAFRGRHGGTGQVPVMINGDITAFGHPGERQVMNEMMRKGLRDNYFYGLGNHDYENNVDDCYLNRCAAGSVLDFLAHYHDKVDRLDVAVSENRDISGSLAYSKVFGRLQLIQLNNYPLYEARFQSGSGISTVGRRFDISSSLEWLEKELREAREANRIILLNWHVAGSGHWDIGDIHSWKRVRELLATYQVTAVFAGHHHERIGLYEDGVGELGAYGKTPVFTSGASYHGSWLIATLDEENNRLEVKRVLGNDWHNAEPVASLALPEG